jgi:hypothetical protein
MHLPLKSSIQLKIHRFGSVLCLDLMGTFKLLWLKAYKDIDSPPTAIGYFFQPLNQWTSLVFKTLTVIPTASLFGGSGVGNMTWVKFSGSSESRSIWQNSVLGCHATRQCQSAVTKLPVLEGSESQKPESSRKFWLLEGERDKWLWEDLFFLSYLN